MSFKTPLVIGLACFGAACTASIPPQELIDARAAFNRASEGPASQLNPAQLHVAQEQLALAEKTFDKEGDTYRTRDAAYVAERKAELAEAQARTTEYDQQVNMAAQEVQVTQARGTH